MKVIIPKQIKVSAQEYEIELVTNLENDYDLWGQCLTGRGVLKIEAGTNPAGRTQTFLHEVMHAINDIYTCRVEEDNIDRMAQGLRDVLVDSLGIEFDWGEIKDE